MCVPYKSGSENLRPSPCPLEKHALTASLRSQRKQNTPLRRALQGRSLLKSCNQTSSYVLFNETLEREEGPFQTLTPGLTGEDHDGAKFQRCFAEHKLGLVSVWCTKGSLLRPSTYTCVCAGHSTQARKGIKKKRRKRHVHHSLLQILCPLPSALALSPLLMIKVCLHLWGNFCRLHLQLPHSTHTHTVTLYKLYQSCTR